jgi:hypothetical protein
LKFKYKVLYHIKSQMFILIVPVGLLYVQYCRCTWQGQLCDIESNFTTTMTDFGICYTFNGNTDPSRMLNVTKPGAGFALSLALNIEQVYNRLIKCLDLKLKRAQGRLSELFDDPLF